MPLYVVAPRSRRVLASYERSPRIAAGGLSQLRKPKLPAGADACVLLLDGERLLRGSLAEVHQSLRAPGWRTFVPVHSPLIPEFGLDLISLQPRWFTAAPLKEGTLLERIDPKFHVAASPEQSRALFFTLRDSTEPWAILAAAMAEAAAGTEVVLDSAMDRLRRLWVREGTAPVLRSLVLRNLIVLLIARREYEKARELLILGRAAYPEYAEICWISAVLWLIQQKFTLAMQEAEMARGINSTSQWVGSDGENSYRAQWLMGVCSAIAGRQEMALGHFIAGLTARPAFEPSVASLLDMRLPADAVMRASWDLCALVRRERQYQDRVFEYLLLHRCFAAARRLAESPELEARVEAAERPFLPATISSGPTGLVIQAPFFQTSSVSRIAWELSTSFLANPDLDVALEPHGFGALAARDVPHGEALAQAMLHHPQQLDLTIRLCWPPDFRRPARGRLAVVFPWEYRGLPKHWVQQMRENVDEVWTPSQFVAGVLERAGMDPERIRVIPNGIDPEVFSPQGPIVEVPGARGFLFLFVGGAIARKGFDLLLDAYGEAFTSADDVSLMVKEFGSSSFYSHNSMLSATQRFSPGSRLPHLILNTESMGDAMLAALYRRSNCLVHPYRGEGFGMTLAEAMACGKPVITTGQGPALEFCSEETGWLIPAESALVPDDPPPLGKMSEPLRWFEPSFEELVRTMRYVYEHREEAARRGRQAALRIHATHTWPQIIEQYAAAVNVEAVCA